MSEPPFDRLHPSLQHHIVNSLGWRTLRPLQEASIGPLLDGYHALLLAPTAGGKTESAIFPILSRMLTERWEAPGVIYLCPIKALLNNLYERLSYYAGLLGRTVGMWHGDVGEGARKRLVRTPPDIILSTPESLEVMLLSRATEGGRIFQEVRSVIIDEIHAFAGDDRGWHLLAVLERVQGRSQHQLQRIGLSATIGNPEEILDWLTGRRECKKAVVQAGGIGGASEPDIKVDYVGNINNAALVISKLHQGEKRLVFCDSRSQVEELSTALRARQVTTFVSHSSLSLDERRQAEEAFSTRSDCVIVATSTLELGIDVGDLDRVIQLNAPRTVASFLQRLGRTGRRAGTTRNCLFLGTDKEGFLRAVSLVKLWKGGFVEPVVPPPAPYHVLVQQILAVVLQYRSLALTTLIDILTPFLTAARIEVTDLDELLSHMASTGDLFVDEGLVMMGPLGEKRYGYRHFMDIYSVFDAPEQLRVLYGNREIGYVDDMLFRDPDKRGGILSLGGRSWRVTSVNFGKLEAHVEPTDDAGRSTWLGSSLPLSFALAQSIRSVTTSEDQYEFLSERGRRMLSEIRDEYAWLPTEGTCLIHSGSTKTRWWTFGGGRANQTLASAIMEVAHKESKGRNLWIDIEGGINAEDLEEVKAGEGRGSVVLHPEPDVKFSQSLSPSLKRRLLAQRYADREGAEKLLSLPVCTSDT